MMNEQDQIDPKVQEYLNQLRAQGQQGQQPMYAANGQSGVGGVIDSFKKNIGIGFDDKAQAKPESGDDYRNVNPNQGGINFMNRGLQGAQGKKVPTMVRYSKTKNNSKVTYSDGTEEVVPGMYKYGK